MVEVCTIGTINLDTTIFIRSFPGPGEEVPVHKVLQVPGGKGANVAVACARILGAQSTALLGALGEDSIADLQLRSLQQEGVETRGIRIATGKDSGQAYVIVDDQGSNIVHTYFASNREIGPSHLYNDPIFSLITKARLIVIMDPPLDTAIAMGEISKRHSKMVLLDLGLNSRLGIKALEPLLPHVDYMTMNESEAQSIASSVEADKIHSALLSNRTDLRILLKMGQRGAMLISSNGVLKQNGIQLSKYGMKAINTVGCGDTFTGVFAAYKASGKDDAKCLAAANAAGALKATKEVTRGGPTSLELLTFLEQMRDRT